MYYKNVHFKQMYEPFYSLTPNVSIKFAYIEIPIMLVYSKWGLKSFDLRYYFGAVSLARNIELRFFVITLFVL